MDTTKGMTLPLEQQVVSLELAKQMKELGFEQESLFYYYGYFIGEERERWEARYVEKIMMPCPPVEKIDYLISAYTVAELGEMLPNGYHTYKTGFDEKDFYWEGMDESDEQVIDKGKSIMADNEANARAKMIIHLKKGKLI